MEKILCPICQINNTQFFYNQERNDNEINYVICRQCGLVYENPRRTKEEFELFYQSSFRDENLDDLALTKYIGSRIDVGESIFRTIEKVFFKDLNKKVKKYLLGNIHFSVLDVGCGVGGILIPFIKAGFNCQGIDTPSFYTKIGREKLKVPIKEVFLNEFESNFKFDIIILNHVLEHFLNPFEDLSKLRQLLKDDGIIYIELPDLERPYNWTPLKYFFLLGHVYYYSTLTLEILLNKSGFERIYLDSSSTPFMKSIFKKKNDFNFELNKEHFCEIMRKYENFMKQGV